MNCKEVEKMVNEMWQIIATFNLMRLRFGSLSHKMVLQLEGTQRQDGVHESVKYIIKRMRSLIISMNGFAGVMMLESVTDKEQTTDDTVFDDPNCE